MPKRHSRRKQDLASERREGWIVKCALTVGRRSGWGGLRVSLAYFGLTRTLNAAAYCASMSTVSAGQQRNGQVAGARDTVYGTDGWAARRVRCVPLVHRRVTTLTVIRAAASDAR